MYRHDHAITYENIMEIFKVIPLVSYDAKGGVGWV